MPSTPHHPGFWDRLFRLLGRSNLPLSRSLVWRLSGLTRTSEKQFEVSLAEIKYRGVFSEYIDRSIWYFGVFAANELDFLGKCAHVLRLARGALTFVDIGANVGQHSLYMASRASRVISFEPNVAVADRLRRNKDLNGFSNIEIHTVGLGAEDGEANLGTGLADNSGARSFAWTLEPDKVDLVPIRHSGRYLASDEVRLQRLDLLKLDVEGFEKIVLTSMRDILERDRPIILFELIGYGTKGGFDSEAELRAALYDKARLFHLEGRTQARLSRFVWDNCAAVCVPEELVEAVIQSLGSKP